MQFTYFSTEKTYTYNLQGTLVIGPQGPKGDSYETLRKDGYRWIKGFIGITENADLNDYELNDEIIGVGTLLPNYAVHGIITTVPMADPETDITYLSAVPI
jgi:hypothetical protein